MCVTYAAGNVVREEGRNLNIRLRQTAVIKTQRSHRLRVGCERLDFLSFFCLNIPLAVPERLK